MIKILDKKFNFYLECIFFFLQLRKNKYYEKDFVVIICVCLYDFVRQR